MRVGAVCYMGPTRIIYVPVTRDGSPLDFSGLSFDLLTKTK